MWDAPSSPQYCNCCVIEKANRERKGNWPHYPCLFNLHIQKTKEDFLSLYTKHCIALVCFIYSCWFSFSTTQCFYSICCSYSKVPITLVSVCIWNPLKNDSSISQTQTIQLQYLYTLNLHLIKVLSLLFFTERLYKSRNN